MSQTEMNDHRSEPDQARLIESADRLRDAGQRQEAAEAYRVLVELLPFRTDIRVQHGNMLKDIGRVIEAEAAYRAALAQEPEEADIHLQLGHALKLQGRRSEALDAYLRAAALAPLATAPRHELFQMGHQPTQQMFFQTELLRGVLERFMEVVQKISDLQNTLDGISKSLPDLTARAAIPIACYDAFRAIYDVPATSAPDAQICFSILLLADSETLENLRAQIAAIKAQTYGNWQLHVIGSEPASRRIVEQASANEARIGWVEIGEGEHPLAAEWRVGSLANTEWLLLLAPGAVLHSRAAGWFATVARRLSADAYISDEEIDSGSFSAPGRLCPEFRQVVDYDTLLEANVFGGTLAIKRNVFASLSELAQAESVLMARSLTLLALAENGRVGHIPCMLVRRYGKKRDDDEHSHTAHAKAVQLHLGKSNLKNVTVVAKTATSDGLSLRWRTRDPTIRIAAIIPTRNGGQDLEGAVTSLRKKAAMPDALDFVVVDNGSTTAMTCEILNRLAKEGAKVISMRESFNWSRLNNAAVVQTGAPLLLFVNDDVRMLTEDWDEILRGLLARPEVGAIGARMLYPDDTLQHAGVLFGWHGSVIHDGLYESVNEPGPTRRWHVTRAVSAVTGAFLGTRREVFKVNGGFDEISLPVSYSDIDYALKLRCSGLKILWTPQITLYHFESKTRGLDHLDPEKHARNSVERALMERRWGAVFGLEPGINPTWHMATLPFRLLSPPSEQRLWAHMERCAARNPWALTPGCALAN